MPRQPTYRRLSSQASIPPAIELLEQHEFAKSYPAHEPFRTEKGLPGLREYHQTSSPSRFAGRFSGWRFGVAASAILMFSVLITNLSFTIWAVRTYKTTTGGIGTLQSGSCERTKTLSTWLHLAINVLGTAMLSGSNYCMQRLCAPTREEVDLAHVDKFWLDIGIVSIRNLTRISKRRLVVWLLLATSSVPLHLLYNSAIFAQTAVSSYNVYVASEDFLTGASFSTTESISFPISDPNPEIYWLRNHSHQLDRLESDACIDAYASTLPTTRSDVIVVAFPKEQSNNSLLTDFSFNPSETNPTGWLCINATSGHCTASEAKRVKPWTVEGFEVQYCLSLPMAESCELKFSVAILSVVIVCNLIKALCTLMTVWKMNDPTLITIGDAICSFLLRPDRTTAYAKPETWSYRSHYWFSAASPSRWVLTNVL